MTQYIVRTYDAYDMCNALGSSPVKDTYNEARTTVRKLVRQAKARGDDFLMFVIVRRDENGEKTIYTS